jgi:hypothetical protein
MLRNSPDYSEITNRQRFPKNNYFCYRWRILDHFSTSIDRQKFHLSVQGADNHRSLLADKVLQLYKARYHGNRQDLIVNLAQDAMKFLDRRRNEHQMLSKTEVLLSKATRDLMDRTFNTLLAFSTELNSLLGLSELFMTATEPEVKQRSNNHETSIAIYIQCHLSTSLFRLVIDGRQDTMSFYLIPADNILGLTELADRYEAIATWRAQFDNQNRVYWVADEGILTEDMLEVACADLLRVLLGTTQEGLSPSHRYSEEKNANYDLSELDPWQRTDTSSASISTDFHEKSGHFLAKSNDSELGLWKKVDNVPDHELPRPAQFSKPAAPRVSAVVAETNAFSITISTAYEPAPVPALAPAPAPAQNPVHTVSSEGTRTDSVPSLATLIRESGQFSTEFEPPANASAPIASAPVQMEFSPEALFFSEEKEVAPDPKYTFDFKSEYYADKPEKKKGVSSKRSTRKANSKKGKKKR